MSIYCQYVQCLQGCNGIQIIVWSFCRKFGGDLPKKGGLHLKKGFSFSIRFFFHDHSRITELQGKGEGISLTLHYHFDPLHRHVDISQAITAESSSLHILAARLEPTTFGFRAQVANH